MANMYLEVFTKVGAATLLFLVKIVALTFGLFVLVSVSAKIQSLFDKE